ncbi:MAG: serine hydrolase domain-containing protein [Ardenticatenaceae bacterium]|nr:serine hydrolase domain-containing protein [Ardenticatenaceae bacterium]
MTKLTFTVETDPLDVGLSRSGVRRVAELFEKQFADGRHPGAQLVVLRHGQVVLDRVVGLAELGTTRSVRPNTLFQNFSCTKPLTAVCVHQLVEKGVVELDAPIGTYWPEFASRGKETATVRHAMLHQAGIPARGLYPQIPTWWRWDRVSAYVANLPAEYEPGSQTAYHLVNYGFILGEIVRRADGRPIEVYMRQELFEPLEMKDAFLGLPTDLLDRAAQIYWGHSDQRNTVLLFRQARHAVMPAATLNCSARDLAIFYQMMLNEGCYNGRQILRSETARAITKVGYAGYDHTLQIGARWSLGFGNGGPRLPDDPKPERPYSFGRHSTENTFGHPGQRSSNGWADWDRRLVFTFTCNQLNGDHESSQRWQELSDALVEAIID